VYAARTNSGSWEMRGPPTDLKRVARPIRSPLKTITQENLRLGSASTQQHWSLNQIPVCDSYSRECFPQQDPSALRAFGKMQEALRVSQEGKRLTAVPKRKASPIIFVLPKANRTQGKAGGRSTERLATARQQPWHGTSPAELPAAQQSLHASLLAALFTSARILPLPSPSRQARARVGRCQGNRSPGEDLLR